MTALCDAKTRSGGTCRHQAGWGTDHPGTGRCKLHGGASNGPGPGNKNAVKHGVYETVVRERLDETQQLIFDAIPADESLALELRILRFKLLRLLEPVERENAIPGPDGIELVTLQVDEVTKAYAIERLIDGIRKLVKDQRGAPNTDGLAALVEAITASRAALEGE
jgi:hypothetical protein